MAKLLSIPVPTLAQTIRAAKRAFNVEYGDERLDAFRPNNLLYPLTTVVGYLLQQQYLFMREQASQATPFGATGSNLDDWLDIYGVTVPSATKATGTVQVTGRNEFALPAGTELARIDGLLFVTTAQVVFGVDTSTISVGVEAEEIGAAYNTDAGEALEIALIDDDLDPTAISAGISGGADPADNDAKEQLIKTRLSQSRIGGTATDYQLLALGFSASIERVFVEPAGYGPGTVVVFPLNRNPEAAEFWELTIPSSGELAALEAYLSAPDIARVNDRISVVAATLQSIDLQIAITPNTAEVQAAVLTSLQERFVEAYAVGGYTIPNSEISGAISAAEGEVSHTLLDVDGKGPGADAVAEFGVILQVGAITFSAES